MYDLYSVFTQVIIDISTLFCIQVLLMEVNEMSREIFLITITRDKSFRTCSNAKNIIVDNRSHWENL